MPKLRILLMLVTLFSAQAVLAADDDTSLASKPCAAVADACVKAGYARDSAGDKKFWKDCMKPVLLDKIPQNVSVDLATAKACRMNKISELNRELAELQSVTTK
jgi:hypothetical protein